MAPSPALSTLLAFAFLSATSSGTAYVFSSFAPQLATRLNLSITELNTIASCGNAGGYVTNLPWGIFVDRYILAHPQMLLLFASLCLFSAYSTVAWIYNNTPSHPVIVLCAAFFLVNCGANGTLSVALSSVARSFPASSRGSSSAIVLAGLGGSAFIYSTLGSTIARDDTHLFLRILAWGTGGCALIASFWVRVIPPAGGIRKDIDDDDNETSFSLLLPEVQPPDLLQVTGINLLSQTDFWLLFICSSLICGSGLVWINNVGVVSHSLGGDNLTQNAQVGIISLSNCAGRLIIGFLSDYTMRFNLQRAYWLIFICSLMAFGQIGAYQISDYTSLTRVSMTLGLAYGMMYGCLPTIVSEFFGMASYAQNWGWIAFAPFISGQLLNLIFGRVYDSHASPAEGDSSSLKRSGTGMAGGVICHLGKECYRDAFQYTFVACILALAASIYLVRHKNGRIKKGLLSRVDPALLEGH